MADTEPRLGAKDAAAALGVSVAWVRARISDGTISPARGGKKKAGRYLIDASELETLRARVPLAADTTAPTADGPVAPTDEPQTALVARLQTERANLLARVAWERAMAQSQQKALEAEQARTERLEAELAAQRSRVEQLKALSVLDRMLGRQKTI